MNRHKNRLSSTDLLSGENSPTCASTANTSTTMLLQKNHSFDDTILHKKNQKTVFEKSLNKKRMNSTEVVNKEQQVMNSVLTNKDSDRHNSITDMLDLAL